ncbi:MAG: peptidylprolyl isomerase [Ignavibacteriae bacterium]|nr:peptidylprolyl isomerase [Ignavibacteriota bacterium]MCB9217629.1 peptidylprolyl isomerase [Ignavibacteria bacterium]
MNTTYRINPIGLAFALLLTLFAMEAKGQQAGDTPDEPVVTHTVVLNTTLGSISIELYGKDAPKTVANFVGLIDSGFYDGILFHRVHPGFVIQAGDPKTKDSTLRSEWGTGGTSIYGGSFADELNPTTPSYKRGYQRGVLAMANRGQNTNTSQFFIMLKDASLPKNYTIFGYVRDMTTVDEIAAVELVDIGRAGGKPKVPVIIESATATVVETEETE